MIQSILTAATLLALAGRSVAQCTGFGVGSATPAQDNSCRTWCNGEWSNAQDASFLCKDPFSSPDQVCEGPCVTCPDGPFYNTFGPADGKTIDNDPYNCGGCLNECLVDELCNAGSCSITCSTDEQCFYAFADSPFCDPGSNTCVGCIQDTDCPSGVCEAGVCAVCRDNGDGSSTGCSDPGFPFCEASGPAPICVSCQFDADCMATDVDFPYCEDFTCIACVSNADCKDPANPTCDASGQCVVCSNDSDCDGVRTVCDVDNNQCVECLTALDCPNHAPFCTDGNVCSTKCSADLDCTDPTKPFCVTGSCSECAADADCDASQVCTAGACVAKPVDLCAKVTCPTSQVCDKATGKCGCSTGLTLCKGHCVDVKTDEKNCGACDKVCPLEGGHGRPTPIGEPGKSYPGTAKSSSCKAKKAKRSLALRQAAMPAHSMCVAGVCAA